MARQYQSLPPLGMSLARATSPQFTTGERSTQAPVNGSFLGHPYAGRNEPEKCVDSEGRA